MWPQCCTSAAALPAPASRPDLDTPQLYLVMLSCYLPSLWWPQKAYNAKNIYDKTEICPLLVPGMVRAAGVIVRSPGPAPPTPASPPSSIFIGLSPRGNKHNLAQDHYTFASAVHCVNNTVNQLVGDTLLFIWNY